MSKWNYAGKKRVQYSTDITVFRKERLIYCIRLTSPTCGVCQRLLRGVPVLKRTCLLRESWSTFWRHEVRWQDVHTEINERDEFIRNSFLGTDRHTHTPNIQICDTGRRLKYIMHCDPFSISTLHPANDVWKRSPWWRPIWQETGAARKTNRNKYAPICNPSSNLVVVHPF
jgi:hypothetical protein